MAGQFFKPTPLGLMLMALIVALLTTGISERFVAAAGAAYQPGQQINNGVNCAVKYGWPTVLEVRTSGPYEETQYVDSWSIDWLSVWEILVAAYVIAMPIGRWISGYRDPNGEWVGPINRGRQNPAAVLAYVWLACIATGAVLAAVVRQTIVLSREGVDVSYPALAYGMALAGMVLATPVTLLVMIVRRWRYRPRPSHGRGFEVRVAEPVAASTDAGERTT